MNDNLVMPRSVRTGSLPSSSHLVYILETSTPASLSNDETSADPSQVEDRILIFVSAGLELSGWWRDFSLKIVYISRKSRSLGYYFG